MTAGQKETRGGNPGLVSNPSEKEADMSIEAPSTHMAKLIAELREPLAPNSIRTLSTTDPLYEEPQDVFSRHESKFRPESVEEFRTVLAEGAHNYPVNLVRLYTLDGERIHSTEGDWEGMFASLPGLPGPVRANFLGTANAVALHDDLIYVSEGMNFLTGSHLGDVFHFVSYAALREQEEAELAAKVAPVLPLAQAAAPAWAEPLTADDFNFWSNQETEVIYTGPTHLTNGNAYLNCLGEVDHATSTVTIHDKLSAYIYVEENITWTPALVRELAAELLVFADHFESAVMTEKCPRCDGALRQFPHDQGALSRADNETIVCGTCGGDEARAGL